MTSARVPISASPDDWQRIAIAVAQRRHELGLRQRDAVERSGGRISLPVWSILENARQANGAMDRESLRGASLALDWPQDHIERLLGAPATPPESATTERLEALEARMDTIERLLLAAIEREGGTVPASLRESTAGR